MEGRHHLQTRFCMPECAKTHLQQSRISKISGVGPPDPPLQGEGRGRKEREGKGKGRREGKNREGKGGTGRDRGGKEGGRGGMGGGGKGRSTWAPPLETSSGSAPASRKRESERKREIIFLSRFYRPL